MRSQRTSAAESKATKPQALTFDLDGTLVDGSGLRDSIARTCATLAARWPELEAGRLVEANGAMWEKFWPEIENQWVLGALDGAALRLEAWRRTLRACGCDDELIARVAVETQSQLERASYRLFDDVREFLSSAKRVSFPLALITNGAPDTQREKLRALDLERRFDPLIVSGEIGVAKPDPAAFSLVCAALRCDRSSIWHVGDSLANDVAGAKAAGLSSVWLNRTGGSRRQEEPEADIEIRSMSDLLALIER
jgi:2-haloalkanoic acid dehalogenase type II